MLIPDISRLLGALSVGLLLGDQSNIGSKEFRLSFLPIFLGLWRLANMDAGQALQNHCGTVEHVIVFIESNGRFHAANGARGCFQKETTLTFWRCAVAAPCCMPFHCGAVGTANPSIPSAICFLVPRFRNHFLLLDWLLNVLYSRRKRHVSCLLGVWELLVVVLLSIMVRDRWVWGSCALKLSVSPPQYFFYILLFAWHSCSHIYVAYIFGCILFGSFCHLPLLPIFF